MTVQIVYVLGEMTAVHRGVGHEENIATIISTFTFSQIFTKGKRNKEAAAFSNKSQHRKGGRKRGAVGE